MNHSGNAKQIVKEAVFIISGMLPLSDVPAYIYLWLFYGV